MSATPDTVVENTISAIRDAIREGRLVQGQRLVVADVCRRFGISAGPVREAIRRLTGEGIVEIKPHSGATVRELNIGNVREIFQLREAIEGLAAKLAAENIGIGDNRAQLHACMEEMRRITANKEPFIEHNRRFHSLIYDLANNDLARETAQRLVLPVYQLRYHNFIRGGHVKVSAAEHMAIAEAIFDGDGVRADRMMQIHIRNSGVAMLRAMETSMVAGRA